MEDRPKQTGLVCPKCRAPVAYEEYRTPTGVVFVCTACGHRWRADEPGTKKH